MFVEHISYPAWALQGAIAGQGLPLTVAILFALIVLFAVWVAHQKLVLHKKDDSGFIGIVACCLMLAAGSAGQVSLVQHRSIVSPIDDDQVREIAMLAASEEGALALGIQMDIHHADPSKGTLSVAGAARVIEGAKDMLKELNETRLYNEGAEKLGIAEKPLPAWIYPSQVAQAFSEAATVMVNRMAEHVQKTKVDSSGSES